MTNPLWWNSTKSSKPCTHRRTLRFLGTRCTMKSPPGSKFQGLLGKDDSQIWLAVEGGAPVGFAHVTVQERLENPFCRERKYWEVTSISVRVDKQRSGVGRQLIEHVVRTAAQNGICDVELSCWCFNSGAQEAFRRLGFVPRWVRFRRSVTPSNSSDAEPTSQAPASNPAKP